MRFGEGDAIQPSTGDKLRLVSHLCSAPKAIPQCGVILPGRFLFLFTQRWYYTDQRQPCPTLFHTTGNYPDDLSCFLSSYHSVRAAAVSVLSMASE